MRSILVGAVGSTRVALAALIEEDVPPLALVTLPISLSKRHSDYEDLRPLAEKSGIKVIEVSNINDHVNIETIAQYKPDYIFVIGWSQICCDDVLRIPRVGTIGYHPAPLPENRGRGVIPWTILQRRKITGSTLFWIDSGIDSGDILMQEFFPLADDETATTLTKKILASLDRKMRKVIPLLKSETAPRIPQDHTRATYCAKRVPADGLIDWREPAIDVWTLIRAVTRPYPGAFTFYKGRKLIIWEADYIGDCPYWGLPGQVQSVDDCGAVIQCGDRKHVMVKKVQLEGEEVTNARDVLRIHSKLGLNLLDMYENIAGGLK